MAISSSSEEDSKSISSDSSSSSGGSSSSGIVVDPSVATGTQASPSTVAASSVVKDAVESANGSGDPGGASKTATNSNLTSGSATESSPSKVSSSVSAVIGAVVNWATGGPAQTATTTAPTVPVTETKASGESGGMATTPTTKTATMEASDNGASTTTATTKEASSSSSSFLASQPPSLPLLHSKSAEAQALLAKDWSELSSAERQTILAEVNGNVPTSASPVTNSKTSAAPFIEDPVMVERCLKQMEQEIQHVRRSRSSYDRAMFLAPHRIKDRKFRLMFLRAEHFDSYRATQRFMKHFEFKNSLFGYEKLVEAIRLDDLNEDDTESYLSGTFQILSRAEAGAKGSSHIKRNKAKGATAAGSGGGTAAAFAGSKKTDQYGRPVTWFAPHLGQFKSYRSMVSIVTF